MDQITIEPLKELLNSLKDIDGFPIALEQDILSLSDIPLYTACPNPYIKDFIEKYGTPYNQDSDNYERTPFIENVTEGKNDPFYMLHSYPTKVPPKAIEKYIEHYTSPGDIIFDGFCGTGMAGVASNRKNRRSILSDLSTIGTFISYNINSQINTEKFYLSANKILNEAKKEYGWMFSTSHKSNVNDNIVLDKSIKKNLGKINYVVWSELNICPFCRKEHVLWDHALDSNTNALKNSYSCPDCNAELDRKKCEKVKTEYYDSALNKKIIQTKQVPVLINYSYNGKRYEKHPDEEDLQLIKKIDGLEIPYWYPINKIPQGDKTGEPLRYGITNIHHFYTKRNLCILAAVMDKISKYENSRLKNFLLCWFTSGQSRLHKMNRYMKQHNRHVGPLSGTLYISPFQAEISPFYFLDAKLKIFKNIKIGSNHSIVTTQSSTNLSNIPNNCIDYIFVDPPFGSNLMYSELNLVLESWIKLITNNIPEAVINNTQNKDLESYTKLMTKCFKEFYRILKPNRWITVEFHNSKASVWNGIQESLNRAGFIIAQVAVLDKKKGTVNQLHAPGTVKNDLIINAYKPKEDFSERLIKNAGKNMEVDFVIHQLEHLPIRPNIERTEKMLYSKMLAHYVENGFKIRYDSTNFYRLLSDNFIELDGFWFLDIQVNKYNEWKKSLSLDQINEVIDGQQVLFVSDEKSAITWIFNFLNKPRTYSEIFTEYQQIATTTDDQVPEIRLILENNFVLENGKYRRPMTDQEKEGKSKNRERELDRTFNTILNQAKNQKDKIRSVRREALIHGFTKCYQGGKYDNILTIADKLHNNVLESSGEIMDFVDIARIKTSGKKKIEDF